MCALCFGDQGLRGRVSGAGTHICVDLGQQLRNLALRHRLESLQVFLLLFQTATNSVDLPRRGCVGENISVEKKSKIRKGVAPQSRCKSAGRVEKGACGKAGGRQYELTSGRN